jgi:large subunit ribosomal protein L35
MKTKKSAAKRFRVTVTGKVMRFKAGKRHILTKKTTKNKRNLRKVTATDKTNAKNVKKLLPYA